MCRHLSFFFRGYLLNFIVTVYIHPWLDSVLYILVECYFLRPILNFKQLCIWRRWEGEEGRVVCKTWRVPENKFGKKKEWHQEWLCIQLYSFDYNVVVMILTLWSHSVLPDDGRAHSVSRSDSQTTTIENSGTEHDPTPPPPAPRARGAFLGFIRAQLRFQRPPLLPRPSLASQRRPPAALRARPGILRPQPSAPLFLDIVASAKESFVRVIYPDLRRFFLSCRISAALPWPAGPEIQTLLPGMDALVHPVCLGLVRWPPALSPPADEDDVGAQEREAALGTRNEMEGRNPMQRFVDNPMPYNRRYTWVLFATVSRFRNWIGRFMIAVVVSCIYFG